MNPAQKSFYLLVLFWSTNGIDQLLPGVVANDQNWGFAIRDGKVAPVILGAGFSKKVSSKYY